MNIVLLDSDKSGKDFKKKLEIETYRDCTEKVIEINDIITIENAEVEDLIPFSLMENHLTRLLRDAEEEEIGDFIMMKNQLFPKLKNSLINTILIYQRVGKLTYLVMLSKGF